MPAKTRLYLDEHVPLSIALGLRRRHIDITTTVAAGLGSASDQEQLQYAAGQGRVLFTHDADFPRLHKRGVQHAGIVYCHQGQYPVREIVRRLAALAHRRPGTLLNRVEFL